MRMVLIVFLGSVLIIVGTGPAISIESNRPIQPDGGPTKVRIEVFLLDVDEIDAAAQNFTANFYMEAQWLDARLAHERPGKIVRSLNEVWHPRLQFLNQQRVHPTFPEVVEITPDGEVTYRQRVWGSFSQPMELQEFPFDRQAFEIRVVAVGYTPEEVQWVPHPDNTSGLGPRFSQPDWDILQWRLDTSPYVPLTEEVSIASFAFIFEADRKIGFFIWKFILSLGLIVAMSWMIFWIDPEDSATQIGVSWTSMLTVIAYRFIIGGLMPKLSYLTSMDYFTIGATLMVFGSLVVAVMTSRLAKAQKIQTAHRIDRWCRGIFPVTLVALFLFSFVF